MRKDVKITIEGKVGSGQVRLAGVINRVLQSFGYRVEVSSLDSIDLPPPELKFAEETVVHLDVRQLPRVS